MSTVKCRYCGKQLDKDTAYKVGKASYYCNEECYNKVMAKRNKVKSKYEPSESSDRRVYTDYIVKIYTDNGYDKSEIPWQLIGAQTKNILQEHEVWSYLTLQYILYYMYEVLELNLFSEESNGSILSLLPFYGIEAEKYFNQTKEIEKSIDGFEFNDNKIVVKKSSKAKSKYKMIDIGGIDMKTHRCKELLEHNNKDFRKVFIRYGKEYDFDVPNNKIGWWLNHVDYDYDWGHEYTSTICMIKYCPFCGEELK